MNNDTLKIAVLLSAILIGNVSNVEVQSEAIVMESNSADFVDQITEDVILVAKAETEKLKVKPKEKEDKYKYVEMNVPDGKGAFKSFMSFKCITNRSSNQHKLQKECWTDENGLRRYTDDSIDFYVGALGSFYGTEIGSKYRITLQDGDGTSVIYLVLGDCKSDEHTNSTHQYMSGDNSVIEFIVSQRELPKIARQMGCVSHADDRLKGKVIKIEKMLEK